MQSPVVWPPPIRPKRAVFQPAASPPGTALPGSFASWHMNCQRMRLQTPLRFLIRIRGQDAGISRIGFIPAHPASPGGASDLDGIEASLLGSVQGSRRRDRGVSTNCGPSDSIRCAVTPDLPERVTRRDPKSSGANQTPATVAPPVTLVMVPEGRPANGGVSPVVTTGTGWEITMLP